MRKPKRGRDSPSAKRSIHRNRSVRHLRRRVPYATPASEAWYLSMPSRSNRVTRVLAACAVVLTTAATPYSYVGIAVLALAGVHRDVAGSQYGLGGGPLLE